MIHKDVSAHDRLAVIDLLRFIAALMVVLFHYTFRGYSADNLMDIAFPELSRITKYAYLGVELFFMISGFVILMSASSGSLRNFVVSRIARLYPAFWICCTFSFLFILTFDDGRFDVSIQQYFLNMTMFHEFVGIPAIDGVYWSLTVEIKFYLFIATILFIKKINEIRLFLHAWLLVSLLNYFLDSWTVSNLFNASYAPYFCLGAYSFLVFRDGPRLIDLAGIILAWFLSVTYSIKSGEKIASYYNVNISPELIIILISIFSILMVFVALRKMQFINFRGIYTLGAVTYPIYLLHQNIGYIIFNRLADNNTRYIALIAIISFIFLISKFINVQIEKPCSRYLKRKYLSI